MKKIIIFAMACILTVAFADLGFALKKDVEFPVVKDEGKVVFSHENHTETKKMECKECHPTLFKMKKGGTEGVTMAAMKEGKNCGACHNGTKAFDANAPENCGKCHVKEAAK